MDIKKISAGKIGKYKDDFPGLYLKITLGVKETKRKWYLKYKLQRKGPNNYIQKEPCIGEWVAKDNNPSKEQYTINGARAFAEDIKNAASKGIDIFSSDTVVENPMLLREKLKEFFEHALFRMEDYEKPKLKWMTDKKRLTYFPEKKLTKDGDNRRRKGKLLKGKVANKSEPSYRDYFKSEEDPINYPAIDRATYWDYVSNYNNWIAQSNVLYKPTKNSTGIMLMNVDYHQVPLKLWQQLHNDVLAQSKSKYIANKTLQMLRVFYNWLINEKDPLITENPISLAMTQPKTGLRAHKIDGKGGFAKITNKDVKRNKDELTEEKLDKLIATIEGELIPEPTGPIDRGNNRALLFILLRLMTGCRPDVSEAIKWADIKTTKDKITIESVRSKGMEYDMNVKFAKRMVFDRIKELKSDEPGHPFIFASTDKRGNQIGLKKVEKTWNRIAKIVKIPKGWVYYNLKHTAISYLMRITSNDIAYVSEVTGVSKATILEYYYTGSHTKENDQKVEQFFENKLKLVVNNK